MEKQTRSRILSALFFFAVFALTIWVVFDEENPREVFYYLSTADFIYLIPAVFFVVAFILGESVVIWYLLKKLGASSRFSHCCLYSFIGFFYSAITPSASGGQPMQVVAMRKDGVNVAVSTVVLAIVTITYKLVLVLLGVGVLVFRPDSIMIYLDEVEPLMYLGLTLNVAFIAFLLLAVFHPVTIRAALNLLFRVTNKIRPFRNPEKVTARLENVIHQYQDAASFLKKQPMILVKVFAITLVQRFCLFVVVWFTYMAFGLRGANPFVVVMLYAMISVAVDMLPLPGGMGISEGLFLAIYDPIFGEALVLPGMLVSRGVSYYTQLVISAVMTGVSQLILGRKKKK